MSPIAEKVLNLAYKQYLKTDSTRIELMALNSNDIFDLKMGLDQLFQDGFIANPSDNILSRIYTLFTPFTFDLTYKAIDYIQSKSK